MTALLQAAETVTEEFKEIEVEFPNLFGGLAINYYRGFSLFGIPIYWYGVLITVGVVLAYFYAMSRTKSFGLNKDRVFDVVFAAIIGGFLGARIYYCVFETLNPNSSESYNFITVFTKIRDGGLAIYGGIIGGFLVGYVICRIRKVNFRAMCDLAALGFLIGQTIGRWGNFINQEAYGEVCPPDYLLGMTGTIISEHVEPGALVHPCFLYESVWCLVGFIGLHFYSKKLRTFDGEIALMYIAWYGLGRSFIEGLRTDSLYAGSFRVSQVLGAVSFVAALILFIVFKIITEKKHIPLYKDTEACKALAEADAAEEIALKEKKAAKRAAKEKKAPSILADGVENDTDETDETDETNETDSAETESEDPIKENENADTTKTDRSAESESTADERED